MPSKPKALRQELQLEPVDTLQPLRLTAPICKEDGIWVYRSGNSTSLSISKLIAEGRNKRHRKCLGPHK